MRCTPAEQAQTQRFADVYARSQAPVMKAIEHRVCGCDYGGNSWTSRREADDLARRLDLRPGVRLLDLGAGSGWPALYLVARTACNALLVDLPEIGLRIADRRAAADGIAERVTTCVADAARLPLADRAFDAISHSDLLCCLVEKRKVLDECRRVVRETGRMAFTVISVAPRLSPGARARAIANGPDFIECDRDYDDMLADAGWTVADRVDLTQDYADACARQIAADVEHADGLAALIGRDEAAERLANWHEKLAAIREGLFRRELFVALPGRS